MTESEPEFRHQLRVRYAETDAGGVAHHSSYVAWLEEARTEWMRQRGRSYADVEASGFFLSPSENPGFVRLLSKGRFGSGTPGPSVFFERAVSFRRLDVSNPVIWAPFSP